jgi:starvation-inducible DNA-binding protein
LDEHAAQVLEMIDEFAERAVIIDAAPLGDPAAYLPAATVRASQGVSQLRDMISEAVENLDIVIRELHADTETAAKVNDIGTADLYTRLVQDYQKQRWFLKEVLRKGDGLVT